MLFANLGIAPAVSVSIAFLLTSEISSSREFEDLTEKYALWVFYLYPSSHAGIFYCPSAKQADRLCPLSDGLSYARSASSLCHPYQRVSPWYRQVGVASIKTNANLI